MTTERPTNAATADDALTLEEAWQTSDHYARKAERAESMCSAVKEAAAGVVAALGEIADAAEEGTGDVLAYVEHRARAAQREYQAALAAWDRAHPNPGDRVPL